MSADNERPRGPSEYATKEEVRPPRRRISFIFKFLGLLILLLAAWIGWYAYREGSLPDFTSEAQQQKMLEQAKKDLESAETTATEASKKFVSWAKMSLQDLKERIKDKPPETKEEVSTLVDESKREVAAAKPPPADKASEKKTEAARVELTKSEQLVKEAREHYRTGLAAYAETDPAAPQQLVQSKLREAEPHFIKCLDLLEQARVQGGGGAELDALEQAAAKRLYDCRKRMELSRA